MSAAATFIWCFVRFAAKKRFTKENKAKGNKYFRGPVDLKVKSKNNIVFVTKFTSLALSRKLGYFSFKILVLKITKAKVLGQNGSWMKLRISVIISKD